MKNKNSIASIDVGNFNIKDQDQNIYENRFEINNDDVGVSAETIKFNGNTYFMGRGEFDREYTKIKKNIEIPVLYAIGKNIDAYDDEIDLMLQAPANQYVLAKQVYKEKFECKEFEFEVNGVECKIKINKVGVLKEGFAAFYSLDRRNEGLICIIDIGGRSTDIFAFKDGIAIKEISIPKGTLDIFENISDKLIEIGDKRDVEDIQMLLENDVLKIDDFDEILNAAYKEIVNRTKTKFNINDYRIKMCGGGSEFLFKFFSDNYDNVDIIQDEIFANAIGAYNIGVAKGLGKK